MTHATFNQNSKKANPTSPLEKALIASEIRYRRLFESAKDGILILDAETGMIVDVNPFLINLLGYVKENFIQKAIWELGFLKDIVQNKEKFSKLQEKEYVRFTLRVICTAAENQKEIIASVYRILGEFEIESADADQREKGKYCVYKIPVRMEKDLPLPPLYSRLGQIKGIKTVL